MLYSIRGKVIELTKRSLIVESYGVGYEVFVAKPDDFSVEEDIFLYLYHLIREDSESLAGFRTKDDRKMFCMLLNVSGIGIKNALSIMSKIDCDTLINAIGNNDIECIKFITGVSLKMANQIILDLKEYINKNNRDNKDVIKKVRDALKSLKFKPKEIDPVLRDIFILNGTFEDILKEALRRLNYAKNS